MGGYRIPALLGRWGQAISNEEEYLQKDYLLGKEDHLPLNGETSRLSTDHLTTDPDTQLGAFGPGADPMRSRAAYPPPRSAVNPYLLLWAFLRPGLGILYVRRSASEVGLGTVDAARDPGLGTLAGGSAKSKKLEYFSQKNAVSECFRDPSRKSQKC